MGENSLSKINQKEDIRINTGTYQCENMSCANRKQRTKKSSLKDRRLNKRLSRLLKWKEKEKKARKSKRDFFSVCSEHCDICYKKISGDTSVFVALDCEFVGVGPGKISALGRCSVVDFAGNVVCDVYSKPDEPITDYRTPWSGITPSHLIGSIPFECAQTQINNAIKDKVIIGHAVYNDFSVLQVHPPKQHILDTSKLVLLKDKASIPVTTPLSLKRMAECLLGERIQCKEHCSLEDSRTTMKLFKLVHSSYMQIGLQLQRRLNKRRKTNIQSISNLNDSSDASVESNVSEKSFLDDEFWTNIADGN